MKTIAACWGIRAHCDLFDIPQNISMNTFHEPACSGQPFKARIMLKHKQAFRFNQCGIRLASGSRLVCFEDCGGGRNIEQHGVEAPGRWNVAGDETSIEHGTRTYVTITGQSPAGDDHQSFDRCRQRSTGFRPPPAHKTTFLANHGHP